MSVLKYFKLKKQSHEYVRLQVAGDVLSPPARFQVCNLDHSSIGIIVNHAVVILLGNILINLLIRVVFPGHPEKYDG
jgi:hypothetical protein